MVGLVVLIVSIVGFILTLTGALPYLYKTVRAYFLKPEPSSVWEMTLSGDKNPFVEPPKFRIEILEYKNHWVRYKYNTHFPCIEARPVRYLIENGYKRVKE